jgi:DEAD/DEAH box helicase domain-containing protein
MSPRLFDRTDELVSGALELVEGCDCEVGCPACVGPRGESRLDGRALSVSLLRMLAGTAAARTTVPSEAAA